MRHKIRADMVLAVAAQTFYKVVGFVVLILLTRYLTQDEFGTFEYAASWAGMLSAFVELGMNMSVIRHIAGSPRVATRYLGHVLSIRLQLLPGYLLTVTMIGWLIWPDAWLVFLLTGVYWALENLYFVFGAVFLSVRRLSYNVVAGVTAKLLLVALLAVVVMAFGGRLPAVLIVHVIAHVIMLGLGYWIAVRYLGPVRLGVSMGRMRRLLLTALPFWLLELVYRAIANVDAMMLGPMHGEAAVAVYRVAFRVFEASYFLLRPLHQIVYPLCCSVAKQKQWVELRRIMTKMLWVVGGVGVAACAAVMVLAPLLVRLIAGEKSIEYAASVAVMRLLYLGVPLVYLWISTGLVALAAGRERSRLMVSLAVLVFNVVLNALVIPRYGAMGAATTTLLSHVLMAVWTIVLTRYELRQMHLTEMANA